MLTRLVPFENQARHLKIGKTRIAEQLVFPAFDVHFQKVDPGGTEDLEKIDGLERAG